MEGQRAVTVGVASPEAVTLVRVAVNREVTTVEYQPCACPVRRLMYQRAWPRLACAVPLPHGPRSSHRGGDGAAAATRRQSMACLHPLLQGGLALGSAEARRLARPVSGLRCSGTLIVHSTPA